MEKISNCHTEVWRDVVGYEGIYRVSSLGRIMSVEREVFRRNGNKPMKEKIMRCPTRRGYPFVVLYKNGKKKSISVHRLVAEAFIPNPNNLPCINHRDEVRDNNRVDNLEWCDHAYNNNYGDHKKKLSVSRGSPVGMIGADGSVVREFCSASEAARQMRLSQGNISACCRGVRQMAGGYKWKYI